MDVLSLLKEDHRTVSTLLDKAKQCEPDDARLDELAEEIESALTVHAAIEEKYFYPVLRERAEESEDTVDVFEAYTEHELVKKLISLLKSDRQPQEQFKAELQVLGENVKHHIKEEESTIFSLARELIDRKELDQLGATMQSAKERLSRGSSNGSARKKASPQRAPARKTPTRKAPTRKAPATRAKSRKR